MEISGSSAVAASANGSFSVKVQRETEELQKQSAEMLIESLPDPTSSLGQNVNVKA